MNIEQSHVSTKTYILSLIAVAGISITGAGIFFTVVGNNEKVQYVNERLNKKTARIEIEILALDKRLIKLEQKNSDNED